MLGRTGGPSVPQQGPSLAHRERKTTLNKKRRRAAQIHLFFQKAASAYTVSVKTWSTCILKKQARIKSKMFQIHLWKRFVWFLLFFFKRDSVFLQHCLLLGLCGLTLRVSLAFWDCALFEGGTSVVIEEKQEHQMFRAQKAELGRILEMNSDKGWLVFDPELVRADTVCVKLLIFPVFKCLLENYCNMKETV